MRMQILKVVLIFLFPAVLFSQSEELIFEPVFNGNVFVRTAGSPQNPAILLVHGAGDEASHIWDQMIPSLADSYFVIVPDLPGFGQSSKENELYDPMHYACFLRWLIDEYHVKSVNLVGHSLGAGISLYFAGMYPNAVDKLVLIDLYGVLHRKVLSRYFADQLPDESKKNNFARKTILARVFKSALNIFNDNNVTDDLESLLQNRLSRKTTLGGKPERIAGLAMVTTDFGWVLNRVKSPTLIMWGSDDQIAPLRTAKVLHFRIKHSKMEVVDSCGHTPMDEKYDVFLNSLLTFLNADDIPRGFALQAPLHFETSKGNLKINKKNTQLYQGVYDSLIVKNSQNILLDRIKARYVQINGSDVKITNSSIISRGLALKINSSDVEIESSEIIGIQNGMICDAGTVKLTAVSVSGDTALKVIGSDLDVAGCILNGKETAIIQPENSKRRRTSEILFSVSKSQYANEELFLHGEQKVRIKKED